MAVKVLSVIDPPVSLPLVLATGGVIQAMPIDQGGGGGGGGIDQLTGDVAAGPGTGSVIATVEGLQGHPLPPPSGSGTVPTWNGATFSWAVPVSSATAIVVANAATLTAFDVTGLPNGTLSYVQTWTTFWVLQQSGNGIAASDGRVWIQNVAGNAQAALAQTDWYVDPIGGDNENPGTIGSPIKTIMGGIVPRIGGTTYTGAGTTIHFVNDEAGGQEAVYLTVSQAAQVKILGEYIAVGAPTTLATVTPADHAAGTLLLVTLTATPGGFASGMFLHNTTKGSRATVNADAAGTLSMTQPLAVTALGSFVGKPAFDDTWAPTDVIQVERPLLVNLTNLRIEAESLIQVQAITTSGDECTVDMTTGEFLATDFQCPFLTVLQGTSVLVDFSHPTGATLFVKGNNDQTCNVIAGSVFNSLFAEAGSIVTLDGNVLTNIVQAITGSAIYANLMYNAGNMFIATNGFMYCGLNFVGGPGYQSNAIWGPGGLFNQGGNVVITNGTATTNLLFHGGIALGYDEEGTGSSYTAGVWTSGIALTPGNIDAFQALANPPRLACIQIQ